MRTKASNLVNGVTLVGVGAILLAFFFTGRLDQYLHPQFRPWTMVAGFIFCISGVVYALAKSTTDCCIEGECVHQNVNNPFRSLLAFVVLFVPLAAVMFFVQRETYPTSPHLEWPGSAPSNSWLQAFAWVREHTPSNSYFAAGADATGRNRRS